MSDQTASTTDVARRAGQDFYHLVDASSGHCVRSINAPRNASVLVNGQVLQVTEPTGRIVLTDIRSGAFLRAL